MTTTTQVDLDALRALEQAATPGPWKADTNTRGDCVLWGPDGQFVANAQAEPHWLPAADGGKRAVVFDVDRRDIALIEAMRNNWTALLDELATERRQGADMASITGEAIRQIGEERDAAREELAKVRADLAATHTELERLRGVIREGVDMAEWHRNEVTTWKRKAAKLREQLAQRTYGPALEKLARDIVGVGADDVHPDEEVAVTWFRLREVLANPATTAEPADEPKAACHLPVQNGEPCGMVSCRKHGCRVAPDATPAQVQP